MKLRSGILVALALALSFTLHSRLGAQEQRSPNLLTTEHYLDWERVSDAQISPDGSRIVYTRQHVNKLEDKWESALWIVERRRHRSTASSSRDRRARWSPDGKRLLYLAEGEPKGSQLFVRWVDADGPATQITHVAEAPRNAALVARRQVDRLLDVRRRAGEVDDQHAGRTEGREVDAGAARRRARSTTGRIRSASSKTASRTCSSCRPKAARRAQLTTGKWSVGAGELRGGGVDRLDARQQVDRVRRQSRDPTPTCSTRRRSSTSSTSRPARFATS